ncbi:MAG: hypothetical protein K2H23_04695 [Oscillospiraceae bacterium]|nr:hypothetical protein [Oscillospiraceae bacterium]
MNNDFNVAEMDLPEYCEETSALPDVESESSFAEQKEEIYRRNIALAADENQIGMITCTSSAFRITDSSSGNSQSCDIEHYDPQYTHFSSPFKYADDEEWHDGLPIAFEFNESNLCEFSLNVYFDPESDNNYNTFVYNSKAGFPQYNQYSDVSFEIPLDEILKYAN